MFISANSNIYLNLLTVMKENQNKNIKISIYNIIKEKM